MPFHPRPGRPEEYPERDNPRRPWDEWGPQEQEQNLMAALGIKDSLTRSHRDAEEIKEGDWVRTPRNIVGRVKILKPPYAKVLISGRIMSEVVFKINDLSVL